MQNFRSEGKKINFTASGAVLSGGVVVVGERIAVSSCDVADGAVGSAHLCGVFELAKLTGTAWVQGDQLFWDVSAAKLTKVVVGNVPAGFAHKAAASGDALGEVNIGPQLPFNVATVVATVAGTLTGTVDGTINDVAAVGGACAGVAEPSATQVDAAIATAVAPLVTSTNLALKELQTQLKAALAALKAAGLMASS